MKATDKLKSYALMQFYEYLDKDPDENIPKALDFLIKLDPEGKSAASQAKAIKKAVADHESNWYKLVRSVWTDIDDHQRKKLVETGVVNSAVIGTPICMKNQEKYGVNVPWAILVDPTTACNLHCTGCWAAEYGSKCNLTFDELDDIIRQGKELGTYVYLFTGGEPLVRKTDIIKLCEKHDDCAFLAFTNATLIDDAFADEMLRVGNFVPAISIEGNEETTDARRGKGTYQKIMAAMERLRARKLIFGASCCYTSANTEVIASEEYFDFMVELGVKFAWFFTYMPIGADAVPELMADARQRRMMYEAIQSFRKTKPLFTIDFWNDGDAVGGCIAGGRAYLHINASGDVEPCAFVHYSDSNIREKTLLEAYQSPLFQEYRMGQPFNENMLRPCPVLDNPGKLTEMVDRSGAHSTDLASPERACDYCDRCVEKAEKWAAVADEIWAAKLNKNGVTTTGKLTIKRPYPGKEETA